MSLFKEDQRVRCISANATGGRLVEGQVYTIKDSHLHPGLVQLDGVDGMYSFTRFETATPTLLEAAQARKALKFRSGCPVKFIAYIPEAKPHCQLVLLNPATGNTVTRFANGKASTEPYDEPGDILVA